VDFLTSIVSAMHLRSALYARFEVRTPWAVRFAPGKERARFGIMIDGDCWMVREGHEPVRLRGGDLFLALDPNALILCDDPQTPPRSCASLLEGAGPDGHVIRFGGAGAPATFITGWFGFDASSGKPILDLLPELLQFRVDEQRDAALRATLDLLVMETSLHEAGGEMIARALADVLFVQAVRAYMAAAPAPRQGLLGALADTRLSRVIHAIHDAPEKSWTVAELAAVAGMSRSAFADTFRRTIGQTPLDYLTQWRIHVAKRLLVETQQSLTSIAVSAGYDANSAFAKAFRRATGVTPAAFRRREWTRQGNAQSVPKFTTQGAARQTEIRNPDTEFGAKGRPNVSRSEHL
jgi:AraC-like DNA-binding protein